MALTPTIYRVAGDDGPPINFEHAGLDATGLTITGRFKRPDGTTYTRVAAVSDVGPPALYSISFQAGDLTEGDHLFDVHVSGAGLDDFSYPPRSKMIMRVRESG